MKHLTPILLLAVAGTLHAEVPLLPKNELKNEATHIVVGKVRALYSTTTKSEDWESTNSVAEIAVLSVEKGSVITSGDVVYAHYWNKRWIGKGDPEPHSSGHSGVAKGDLVRAHLSRKHGTYHVLLPNGFTKLKAEEVQDTSKNATAKLQGTWNVVYYEEKGAVEDPGTKQFVIKDNRLEFRSNGQTKVETTIEVSGSTVDQKFSSGDVYRSLFLRAGDYWIICGNRKGDRPTEFSCGTAMGGEFFIVLKHE